jgi:phosphatidylserine synthase
MAADMSDPKYWIITAIFYLAGLICLWKINMGESQINLTGLKIAISACYLPACMFIVYKMSSD